MIGSRALLFIFLLSTTHIAVLYNKPRLTIMLVIDQFAYSYFPQLTPFFKHGFRFFLNNAINYKNAYYPHGIPSTAPGHTGLSTGVTPHYHGIIANSWCNPDGQKITADSDDSINAAVINPKGGYYDYAKGPCHIMVDSLSDQFALSSQPNTPRTALSLSMKSRSAICTANKKGKAIWFDIHTGCFTSSKAYYQELPEWLITFNKEKNLSELKQVTWDLVYPRKSCAYKFIDIDNYQYASKPSIVGKTSIIDHTAHNPFSTYQRTPAANKLLFDLALHSIKTHLQKNNEELLLWLCLSPLDMIGHEYGPQSREVIDMIYHLDVQVEEFMKSVEAIIKPEEILWALTADHGITPIPELLAARGYKNARRVHYTKIIPSLNAKIKKEVGVDDLICNCGFTQIYIKDSVWNGMTPAQLKNSTTLLTDEIKKVPGIKRIWSTQELTGSCFDPDSIENHYKNQLYPGRSGRFILQPEPFCVIDDFDRGTGHRTPYDPDTHVPLFIYQKDHLKPCVINERVWTLQLANTIAQILHISKPSASTYNVLPGLRIEKCGAQ